MAGVFRILSDNHILNALPKVDLGRLAPHIERVNLKLGDVLYHSNEKISHVYFPDRSLICVVAYTSEGQGDEIAVIGSEGATGLDVVMGSDVTLNEHIILFADGAFRIPTAAICEEFHRGEAMQILLLQFIRKMMAQISQTALCNRLHNTRERLARWLLMCHDRVSSDVLHLTQEFIAIMLGANRATVTLTAIELQHEGLISYKRGYIQINDRQGLEDYSCECYQVINSAYLSK